MFLAIGVLLAVSMVLGACAPKPVPTPAPTQPPATAAPTAAPTEEPTPAGPVHTTDRHGGWLDQIVFSVVSADAAVTQIQAGAIDIYAGGLSSADFPSIQQAGLSYATSNGLYYDILYNPGACTDTTKFNPFSNRKIREATNYLYDRNYINQEVYAGGGLAKFFAIQTNGPDYADLADVVRAIESKYAYNLDKAKQIISDELTAMGATLNADGKWEFGGSLVSLIFLIRNDSDKTRIPIGDYVANQLEAVGFTVDRQYKRSREASPLWIGSNPHDCLWHVYTAAWSSTVIDRDEGDMFQQMYLPSSVQGMDVFIQNVVDPAFQAVGDKLATGDYTTLEERRAMMVEAMPLALEDSVQVWLIDGKNYTPYVNNMIVTADLAAGVEGAQIYPYTVRFAGEEGGSLNWGEPDLFAEPWNPVAGSNWAFDQAAMRATAGAGVMYDPFTGLTWPLRIERAEVTVQTGLPVSKTHDWVSLEFADTIAVPADAWVDWDATNQTWIPAGEGKTAKIKSVVYYPADFFTTVKYHDGSSISLGDFLMAMILPFDRAKPESAIYDEQAVPNFESFMSYFKGFKIASTDPLVIEYYHDFLTSDAELLVTTVYPSYTFAEAGWPIMAVANMAEAAGEIAYSDVKAGDKTIEQTSFIGGPTLTNLAAALDKAIAENYIPYAPTMGQYVTADEAAARYANLKAWYAAHGNFWVGTGPYYMDKAYLVEKSLVLKSFSDYPDYSDRWDIFSEPRLAEVEITAPAGQVKIGSEATFDVTVTFKGAPYALADIKMVKFLLYDATGALVKAELATPVADGQYKVVLTSAMTSALAAGSNKLEVAVVPIPVTVPTFASVEFVTVP
jgi:peptide/nickel transport system substrate-binding protein